MDAFAQIERRIERLHARASSGEFDERLAAELDDVLEHGYLYALRADAAARRLHERLSRLLSGAGGRSAAEEVARLSAEKQQLEETAHRVRERLTLTRALVGRLAPPCASSR
jgi:hypothetical protein